MTKLDTWLAVLQVLAVALALVGLLPDVALAQGEEGGRAYVAHAVVSVLLVGAVLWAVCRTSHR